MIWEARPTGKRGRQPAYGDAVIQTCLSMKVLFGMALRPATGFVGSLLDLIGLEWSVPDFSTLSRHRLSIARLSLASARRCRGSEHGRLAFCPEAVYMTVNSGAGVHNLPTENRAGR